MVRQVLAFDEEIPTPVHRLAYACAEDPAHAPPPTLLEETLLEEFLTPLQYANLARLGHDLAAAPLAELVEARTAATRRKSSPAAVLISRKRMEECADCPLLSSRF